MVSRHWAAFRPPLTPASVARVKSLIPEFAYPDEEQVRASWSGFLDQAHMDKAARGLFTQWLLTQLR